MLRTVTGAVPASRPDDNEEEVVARDRPPELRGRELDRVRLGTAVRLEFVEPGQLVHRVRAQAVLGPQVTQFGLVQRQCGAQEIQRHFLLLHGRIGTRRGPLPAPGPNWSLLNKVS